MTHFLAISSTSRTLAAAAATCSVATAIAAINTTWNTKTSCQQKKVEDDQKDSFRVEVHLMDKIQQKTYLESSKDDIPSTLRILAVDLPEMRTKAFSGDCRLSHDKVFVDDIARPKIITLLEGQNSQDDKKEQKPSKTDRRAQQLKIAQKALIKVRYYYRREGLTPSSRRDGSIFCLLTTIIYENMGFCVLTLYMFVVFFLFLTVLGPLQ
jgi:hypothetical protein